MNARVLASLMLLSCAPVLAFAQTSLGGPSNSKKPIEIASDNLEVLQNDNKAIFTGNVIAKQGTATMRAAKMIVFYTSSADKTAAPAPATGGAKPPGGSDIERIESSGNVVFTTPDETAQGDTAIYKTKEDTIDLVGNVVLTKQENVLKGNTLNYNMATGRSVLSSGGGGRVRGLFVPKKDDGK